MVEYILKMSESLFTNPYFPTTITFSIESEPRFEGYSTKVYFNFVMKKDFDDMLLNPSDVMITKLFIHLMGSQIRVCVDESVYVWNETTRLWNKFNTVWIQM
jgi:hypothetical protein